MLVIDESNRNAVVPALRRAAEHAEYRSSRYHRTAGSAMGGQPVGRRWPHPSRRSPDGLSGDLPPSSPRSE
jgi:hypothetical protein